jgi:hypothetical protein
VLLVLPPLLLLLLLLYSLLLRILGSLRYPWHLACGMRRKSRCDLRRASASKWRIA